ncbi:metal ABC transporter permease [Desulfuromonas sp. AOP6]|uniref:metal ABC transporter permease n=1 Tax=Desulfuromonas sp. AOP6 TaxID=1566351 RepID=UPI0012810E7E|nr:metal ABC transporter permease [Desulfuromonas sp. AOP6]BCA80629.1 metal ABC transporter permease [Desulfuromonas sp. AOP6]
METFFEAVLNQTFMLNALIGGLLASIACGIVGSFVVVKRIGYIAGGIAHAVLGGMGIAYYFGYSPIGGAIVAALLSAGIIGWINLHWKQQEDTIISALWSVGMATGVLFIARTPGYNVDLMSYLFGNILMIPRQDLYLIFILDLAIALIILLFYKQFLAVAFDEEFARLRGVRVDLFYLLLLALVSLTVVILIQVVGLIMVIALLTLPAAIAGHFVHSLAKMMVLATLFGAFFTTGGLFISYQPDLPAGATTVLLAGLGYLLSSLFASLRHRFRRPMNPR